MRIFNNWCNGGRGGWLVGGKWEIFARNGEKPGMQEWGGGWFYIGGR